MLNILCNWWRTERALPPDSRYAVGQIQQFIDGVYRSVGNGAALIFVSSTLWWKLMVITTAKCKHFCPSSEFSDYFMHDAPSNKIRHLLTSQAAVVLYFVFCQLLFLIFFRCVHLPTNTVQLVVWISERRFWYSIDLSEISLQSTINWQKRHNVNQIICLWESKNNHAQDRRRSICLSAYTRLHLAVTVASRLHPDLNPVDYNIWGILQQQCWARKSKIWTSCEWERLDHNTVE